MSDNDEVADVEVDRHFTMVGLRIEGVINNAKGLIKLQNNNISVLGAIIDELKEHREKLRMFQNEWLDDIINNCSPGYNYHWGDKCNEYESELDKLITLLRGEYSRASYNSGGAASSYNSPIRLPKLELPEFSGKIGDWISFWQSFRPHVHDNQALPPVTKFTFLKNSCKGVAHSIINNYNLDDTGYQSAIAGLLDFYEDPQRQRNNVIDSLLDMKAPTDDAKSIQAFSLRVKGLINDMQNVELVPANLEPVTCRLIIRLCPDSLLQKIYVKEGNYPDLIKILRALDDIIKTQEDTAKKGADQSQGQQYRHPNENRYQGQYRSQFNRNPAGRGVPRFQHPGRGRGGHGQRSTSYQVSMSGQYGAGNKRCIFCNEFGHGSAYCPNAITVKERYSILHKMKVCTRCMSRHDGKCGRTIPCYRCGGDHHTWLHQARQGSRFGQPPGQSSTTVQLWRPPSHQTHSSFGIMGDDDPEVARDPSSSHLV